MKLNIHLQQLFYLLTNTWKYGGSLFGTEAAGGSQTEQLHMFSGLKTIAFSLILWMITCNCWFRNHVEIYGLVSPKGLGIKYFFISVYLYI